MESSNLVCAGVSRRHVRADVWAQLEQVKTNFKMQKTARRRLCVRMNAGAGSFQFDAVPIVVMRDVIMPPAVTAEDARNPLAARSLP